MPFGEGSLESHVWEVICFLSISMSRQVQSEEMREELDIPDI